MIHSNAGTCSDIALSMNEPLSQGVSMKHAKPSHHVVRPARRPATSLLMAGMVAVGLAGCAAGPDFQRPAAPAVAQYTPTSVASQTVSAPTQLGQEQRLVDVTSIEAQWWRSLGSSALNQLIDDAFKASPTLAAVSANLREAQERFAAREGSTRYPQVDAALGGQRQQTSPSSQGLSGDTRQFSLYNASVGVHYNFDLAGGNRRALEALAARTDYRRYELNAARLTLAGNIATAAITRARLAAQMETTTAI